MTNRLRAALGGTTAAVAGLAIAATAFVAPAAATVSTPNLIAPTPGATQINLLGFNDFHGRILTADKLAATIFTSQAAFGAANSIVLSNGDNVGASLFESSILNDQPALDQLNVMGVQSNTVGNHEFDKGAADAQGRIQSATNGADLAANVTAPDGSKPFGEFALFTVQGKTVAIIGAVTQETTALVSPDGVAGWTFGDPVAAVNDVAARLTDGNPANGEADILVASYHEGGPETSTSLADNLANSTFAHLANDTSAKVSAIFTAHTHQKYAYDAPVGATTRPIVQAGNYAEHLAQVVLTIDANGKVTAAESSIVPAMNPIPAALANDPRILQIQGIRDAAVAQSNVLGAEIVGKQSGDISRAKTGTGGEDRANASSLGDVVATSMLESITAAGRATPQIALMNPGGLRADLLNNDGVITYKEAATVLPFANNLSVATVTGAQLKQILEEQWQRAEKPNDPAPSRPYLQLGVSDGFTYTYDESRPMDDRITGMYLNGVAIDPAASYGVAAPTFLTAGGDNFRGFRQASKIADTGMIDLDAFVNWIKAETAADAAGVVPNQTRNGFQVAGFPTAAPIACGDSATFTVSRFDQGSLGAIVNTELVASASVISSTGEKSIIEVGRAAVTTPNTAELTITIPSDFATDTFDILIEAKSSGSYVILPLAVECAAVPTTTAPASAPAETTWSTITPPATPSAAEGGLASTGADSFALFGGIAAALTIIALGGVLLLRRRHGAE